MGITLSTSLHRMSMADLASQLPRMRTWTQYTIDRCTHHSQARSLYIPWLRCPNGRVRSPTHPRAVLQLHCLYIGQFSHSQRQLQFRQLLLRQHPLQANQRIQRPRQERPCQTATVDGCVSTTVRIQMSSRQKLVVSLQQLLWLGGTCINLDWQTCSEWREGVSTVRLRIAIIDNADSTFKAPSQKFCGIKTNTSFRRRETDLQFEGPKANSQTLNGLCHSGRRTVSVSDFLWTTILLGTRQGFLLRLSAVPNVTTKSTTLLGWKISNRRITSLVPSQSKRSPTNRSLVQKPRMAFRQLDGTVFLSAHPRKN